VTAPVLIVSGSSGVGKSTVSRSLAEKLTSGVHLPMDVLLGLFSDPYPDPASSEGVHRYAVVGAAGAGAAARLAKGDYTVILDTPMLPDGAAGVAHICGRFGVQVHYAVLRADVRTCLERIQHRDRAAPPDIEGMRSLHARFVDLGDHEGHAINAEGPAADVVARVLSSYRDGRLALAGPSPGPADRGPGAGE
jgi:predicted kinase